MAGEEDGNVTCMSKTEARVREEGGEVTPDPGPGVEPARVTLLCQGQHLFLFYVRSISLESIICFPQISVPLSKKSVSLWPSTFLSRGVDIVSALAPAVLQEAGGRLAVVVWFPGPIGLLTPQDSTYPKQTLESSTCSTTFHYSET